MSSDPKYLRECLGAACAALAHTMHVDFQAAYFAYYGCGTRAEAESWERMLEQRTLELAKPADPLTFRVQCPLCEHGGAHDKGLVWPDGMKRHLRGDRNSAQCEVLAALLSYARIHFGERLSPTK